MPSDYLPQQKEISEKMRTILIDWLIQVHLKFNLLQETLYLTVYTIDRYLDAEPVKRADLQLVGVTAMLLASKYEEMYAPEVADFVYITDNAYSKEKIKSMEQKMMKALKYDFSNPLCLQFLRRNSKAGEVNATKHTLAKFLMELSLISYKLTRRYPSEIAAASLFLSMKLIDSSEWTPTLEHYSGYCEEELLPVVGELASLAMSMEGSKYEAVKSKYSASKYLKVTRITELKASTLRHYSNHSLSDR
jgi:cyclin B